MRKITNAPLKKVQGYSSNEAPYRCLVKWVTKDNEFPMPDVYEEALDYCYKMTSEKMNMKNSNVM